MNTFKIYNGEVSPHVQGTIGFMEWEAFHSPQYPKELEPYDYEIDFFDLRKAVTEQLGKDPLEED